MLAVLVKFYEAATGDRIRTARKRNYLAAAYRVHGSDVTARIEEQFARAGTATNLLGIVRSTPPAVPSQALRESAAEEAGSDHDRPPCPIELCLPDLIYCDVHRPPFDPTSTRRYDRRPSNPEAAVYCSRSTGR